MVDKGKGRRRGPLADKSEVLTTRITQDTRHALEASADQAGRSISQQVELLLVERLHGSDGSLRHLEAVLETVLAVGRRLSLAEEGAGTRDSAFVYFGVIKALAWAQDALPVPKDDARFKDVALLDAEIQRVRRARADLKAGRRLDARTDEERLVDLPADDIEKLERELVGLIDRREAAMASVSAIRTDADIAARDVIAEIAL